MKKTTISVLCIALLAINAFAVLGAAQSYTEPRSQTRMGSIANMPNIRAVAGCNLKVTASPADTYFIGKARSECATNNKGSYLCIDRCWEQVNLLLRGSSAGRTTGAYSRYGCKDLDSSGLAKSTASSCNLDAANLCSRENYGNDYCKRKCAQKAYSLCRRRIYEAQQRYA